MRLFFSTIVIFVIFVGCSGKKYFEPQEVSNNYNASHYDMPEYIKSINKTGATLEDYKIINKDGISTDSLPEGYYFLNKVDKVIIAGNSSKQLLIKNTNNILTFKQNVIAATLKSNLLALIFEDNSIAIFDLISKKFKLKEYQEASLANDHRIANPIFLDDIILFPTLNGNVIITSNETFKIIKTITIDPDNTINNIIFLQTIGDTMVAATTNKILALGDGQITVNDYTIKDIIYKDQYLYVATLDGTIMKLNLSLEVLAKHKFKFAKIYSLGFGTKLYALESQDYLIELSDDFSQIKVYNFDFDETKKTLVIDDILYFDDEYVKLK